ncbi:acyl carrier protein [Paenibacillus sp. BJ-4]|uniref:acyl carrier protein n=1 Tax=Paenibacillus sp. BJ-4 TaxID=2878097 RepID=UPI001CF06148|nr:acyl carrier protein [Paenibacillus sp. BJ-4]
MIHTEKVVKIIEEVIDTKVLDYSINPFNHGLDSLGVLKLITILEEELSIEIDDNDLTVENMSSVNSIISMVYKYVNE